MKSARRQEKCIGSYKNQSINQSLYFAIMIMTFTVSQKNM